MAAIVQEIMNREVFSVRPEDRAEAALNGILALGISGAPVLDDEARPVGMLSLRDLVGRNDADRAADRMRSPAVVIRDDAPIAAAARLLGQTGRHRAVVVDAGGRAVGVVSALDVVRGLVGLPAVHPAPFPHLDRDTGLGWTDDLPLGEDAIDSAPEGPGLLVLVHGGAALPERVVWAEACDDVRRRLAEMVPVPQTDEPLLAWWLARGGLRFRAAAVPGGLRRRKVLQGLLHQARLPRLPSWI